MKRTTITLLAAIVLLASCNQYQKTPSGLSYKITRGKSNDKLKQGQFVKFNIEYKVPPKDSVFTTSYGHMPAYIMVDTTRPSKHSFLELITQCAPGDRIDFVMSADTLKKLGMLEYNNIFHVRDLIKGKVEFIQVFASQAEAAADNQKEAKLETDREIKSLKDLADKKGVKTQSTPGGVLVEITVPGDMTQKADSGKTAKVMYRGTLADGTEFDANVGPKHPNGAPLVVNVGTQGGPGSVIPGMDEALHYFGKGTKGKIYIPAMLAYGQGGQPPVIPQYANLVFEIEVIDVAPTPVAAPQPTMPMPQMQQQPQRKR